MWVRRPFYIYIPPTLGSHDHDRRCLPPARSARPFTDPPPHVLFKPRALKVKCSFCNVPVVPLGFFPLPQQIWWTIFSGYLGIFLLSTGWILMMLKEGPRAFLVFDPKSQLRGLVKSD